MTLYNQLSPYTDIQISDFDSNYDVVTSARQQIVLEIKSDIGYKEKYMLPWFEDEKWYKNAFDYCDIVFRDGDLVALSGNKILADNTIKILCHYYVMKKYRVIYRGLQQTDLIPKSIATAKTKNLKGVWYSVHAFDKRHERLIQSQIRGYNGSKLNAKCMPYWLKTEYHGEINYNHTIQHKFYIPVT